MATENGAAVAASSDRRVGRGPGVLVASLVIAGAFVMPLALAAHYGAFGIPRSDDWSYLVTLFRWVDDGRLSFNHWVSMTLVGQLALATPLAKIAPRSIEAQQIQTAFVGLGGLGALGFTARRLGVDWFGVMMVVGGIAFSPLWGPLAVSFMTDIPTFTVSTIAVALAVAGWRRTNGPGRLLALSMATAAIGFTIRQYAIVPGIAVGIVAAVQAMSTGDRAHARRWVFALTTLGIGALAFVLWWQSIPDGRPLRPGIPTAGTVRHAAIDLAGLLRLVTLLSAPALLACRPARRLEQAWTTSPSAVLAVGGATALWLAVTAARVGSTLFIGNYVEPDGVLANIVLAGRRPDVLPDAIWNLLVLMTSIGGVALTVMVIPAAAAAYGRLRSHDRSLPDPARTLLALTTTGYVAAYTGAMLTGLQVYDRYALPLAACVGLLLVATPTSSTRDAGAPRPPRLRELAGTTALIAVAAIGTAYTADSASFDGARWQVAEAAVRAGWPARTVNGGFEWRNYHRGDKLPVRQPGDPTRDRVCVTVRINPSQYRAPGSRRPSPAHQRVRRRASSHFGPRHRVLICRDACSPVQGDDGYRSRDPGGLRRPRSRRGGAPRAPPRTDRTSHLRALPDLRRDAAGDRPRRRDARGP